MDMASLRFLGFPKIFFPPGATTMVSAAMMMARDNAGDFVDQGVGLITCQSLHHGAGGFPAARFFIGRGGKISSFRPAEWSRSLRRGELEAKMMGFCGFFIL